MKKLIKNIFLVAFGAIALVSCNDNDPNDGHFGDDNQSGWIQFEDESTTYAMSGLVTEIKIPVVLNAPVNTDGLTFTYTVTDIQGSTAGYLSHSGTGVVPKNSLEGFITLNLPAEQQTSCREFVITLTATSRANVQVGLGNNEKPIARTIIVGRGRDSFVGTYAVVEDGSYNYTTTVTAGDEPNELVIKGLGDWSPTSETSVYLDPNRMNGGITLGNFNDNFLFMNGGDPIFGDNSEIANTIDFCTAGFTINYILTDIDGNQLSDSFEDVFTKLP